MEYQDYYKILGVNKNASVDEIKKQYRRLARKYHPDVSKEKNAEAKFKQVKEAYEVLKDTEKRKAYDQLGSYVHTGSSGSRGHGFTPPPGWHFYQSSDTANSHETDFETTDFSDFFTSLFGQATARRKYHSTVHERGKNQHSKIKLSLEEAFCGTERIIQFQEPQINLKTGEVELTPRRIKVKIPPGVTEGQQIRLAGQGSQGVGGAPNGDLYLEIQLMDHPIYTVKNRDIYLNLPVSPWEAALGAKIPVPTLAGKVELTIPPGSQTGKKLRLKGRGLPNHPPGDQYVILTIYTPMPKTDSQRKLYEKLAEETQFNPRSVDHFK